MNYFNYFTEIEEHFQRRRGTTLLLSTLDWALIETWKDAGIPLEGVLRGIDAAFEKFEKRPQAFRKVNSLAYCSQAVLEAAAAMQEAEVGGEAAATQKNEAGLDRAAVAAYLKSNAERLGAKARAENDRAIQQALAGAAESLDEMAAHATSSSLEELERRLSVWEEKINAALLAAAEEDELLAVRAEAERDIAPFRRHMSGPQLEQLQRQYTSKRLLGRHGLPRLSLFYM